MSACKTPNCDREVPYTGHGYCQSCLPVVLRTGRPPELRRVPAWIERMQEGKLPAKELAA